MDTLRTLFAPLKYLRAKNDHKFVWDWVLPAIVAVAATLCLFVLPRPVSILGEKGLVHWVNELLQVLIGFYIAALAAIASFDRPSLDQPIEGEGVTLKVLQEDGYKPKQLNRRAFLSLLFGYLSLLAIFLYVLGLGVSLLSDNIRLISPQLLPYLRGVFVLAYGFFFTQMLSVTMVALFYLSDRIHRQTPTPLPAQDVESESGQD
jgi:hypothetical protein